MLRRREWKKALIAPTVLIGSGLLVSTHNGFIDKWQIKNDRDEIAPNFHTNVDSYLQFAPMVAVYAFNAFGWEGEHRFVDRTLLLVKSELLMGAIVYPLKKLTNVTRPDGTPESFPSGHTAQAFVAATFLHKEYGKGRPWVSVLGYATATSVGVMRVLNNRHWASDVLAGAGIGILSTNVVYLTHSHNHNKKRKLTMSSLLPLVDHGAYGAYARIVIN